MSFVKGSNTSFMIFLKRVFTQDQSWTAGEGAHSLLCSCSLVGLCWLPVQLLSAFRPALGLQPPAITSTFPPELQAGGWPEQPVQFSQPRWEQGAPFSFLAGCSSAQRNSSCAGAQGNFVVSSTQPAPEGRAILRDPPLPCIVPPAYLKHAPLV